MKNPAAIRPFTARPSRIFLAASIATLFLQLALSPAPVHAATIVTNAGVTETFAAIPAATEWSTTSVAGGAGDVTTTAQMDAEVAVLTAAGIAQQLGDLGVSPPVAGSIAEYDSVAQNVQTRPTGFRLVPLMASLQNGTGAPVSLLDLDYDLGANAPLGESPGLAGHRVYFSLDGTLWNAIVPISGNGTPGRLATTVDLGSWAANAPLFILWADDNGPSSPDTGFTLDNVHFQPRTIVPPGKTIIWNRAHAVGGTAPNGNWDLSASNYWLDGANPAAFVNNDIAVFSQDGDTTITVPADITPNSTRVTHAAGIYTIGGAGRIAGALTKSNAGTLVLTSANTFTGTTLSGGTIITQAAGALGTGGLTLEGTGGTLRTEADISVGGLNGTGPLLKTGTGALALTGVGGATGGITVQAGKLQIDNDTGIGGATQSVTLDGTTLEATNGGGDVIFSVAGGGSRTLNFTANGGTVSVVNAGAGLQIEGPDTFVGSGTITKIGDGALRMRADQNTLSSAWIVNAGTLEYGDATVNALGSGNVTVNPGGRLAGRNVAVPNSVTLAGGELGTRTGDGTNFTGAISVTANSTVTMRSYTTNANPQLIMISGVLSGAGELTLNGNNPQTDKALILTNISNSYGGTFRVSAAQILASEPALLAGSTLNGRPVVLSNGTLRVRDDGTGNNTTLLYNNNITVDTGDSIIDVDHPLVGVNTGNTVQLGTLAIGAQRLTVNGANNYGVAFNGATTLSGDAILATNADLTLQGGVSGTFGMTKEGAARLLFTGTNTYSGATTVNGGALGGTGSLSGGVTVNSSGSLAPGTNGPGIFSIGGDLLLNTGTSFNADLAHLGGPVPIPGTHYDRAAIGTGGPGASTGTVTLGGANLVLTIGTGIQMNDLFFIVTNDGSDPVTGIFNGLADGFDFLSGGQIFRISYDANSTSNTFNGGNDIALLAVPEPGSAALLLLGSALLLPRRRR